MVYSTSGCSQPTSPDEFWPAAASQRLAELINTPQYQPSTVCATIKAVNGEIDAMYAAINALVTQRKAEEDAALRALSALHHHYDHRIEEVNAALRPLRERRNALTSVSRLPPEILNSVFAFLTIICPPTRELKDRNASTETKLGWIVVSYVCRRWRSVALDNAHLWARISFPPGAKWVEAMFSRAKSSPLLVGTSSDASGFPDIWPQGGEIEHISRHIHHTKLLRLLVYEYDVLSVLNSPAPLLETLELVFDPEVQVPSSFFAEHTPALRRLCIHSQQFVWTCSLLKNLTSLELRSDPGEDYYTSSLNAIFRALSGLPLLERLTFTLDSWPLDIKLHSGSRSCEHQLVSLSKLCYLHITGFPNEVGTLLTHLAFPSNTTVAFEFWNNEGVEPEGVPMFLHALLPCLRLQDDASARPISKLSISPRSEDGPLFDDYTFSVRAWRRAGMHETPDIVLNFWQDSDESWQERGVPAACVTVFSEHLEELHAEDSSVDMRQWEEITRHVPRLRKLSARRGAATALCDALHAVGGGPSLEDADGASKVGDPGSSCFMPTLCSLALSDLSYGRDAAGGSTLLSWLAARAEVGRPLKELDVTGCRVHREFVRKLQEAVPGMVVKWTGTERPELERGDLR